MFMLFCHVADVISQFRPSAKSVILYFGGLQYVNHTITVFSFSGHDYNLRERKAKEVERRFTHGTGDQHELQVHFYAMLDPAFGGSENMYIVFGRPIGEWLQESRIPVKSCG